MCLFKKMRLILNHKHKPQSKILESIATWYHAPRFAGLFNLPISLRYASEIVVSQINKWTFGNKLYNVLGRVGMWPSLVGHCVRDAGVARSNRAIPTILMRSKFQKHSA